MATTYTISYNKNTTATVSNMPSSQTKTHGTALTLRTNKPTRTGYTFQKWNTKSGGTGTSYSPGAKYTANAAATLYAQWKVNTYAVKYNANGGSGAPAEQVKTYGIALKMSTVRPTRTDYNFLGWATSSTATTAAKQPGDSYTTNSAITFYAVWAPIPKVASLTAVRCDSSGTAKDDGTYAKVTAKWTCTKSATAKLHKGTAEVTSGKSGTWSGTGGTATAIVLLSSDSSVATASKYTFKFTVTCGAQSTMRSAVVSRATFTMDFKAGGNGVGILSAAPSSGLAVGAAAEFASMVKTGGDVKVQTANIDRDGPLPAESQFSTSTFRILDVDGVSLGYVDACRLTDGRIGMRIVPFSGTDMFNYFGVYVDQNGNCSYGVKDGAAFRNAINAMGAPSAATMNPSLITLGSAGQLWSIRATCINQANTTYNGHDTGLLVVDDGIALYDWSDGTGATQWKLDATTDTTTTLSSIMTAASGITLSSPSYSVCGKVAMLSVAATGFAASTGSQTVGTVVSGKRPVQAAYGNSTSRYVTYTQITTAGAMTVYWNTAPSSDSTYTFKFMYLLP